MKPDYDVVVVGGGPAGATAARCLVEAAPEARVLLVEKEEMPRDKPCGGFVASQLLEAFPLLQGKEDQFIESVSREGILHSPDLRYQVGGRTRMLAVLRSTFDSYLVGLAQQAGVTVSTARRVQDIKIRPDGVTIKMEGGGGVTSRAVVGADGASSLVARRTGLHRGWLPSQVCRCIVREILVEPDFIAESYGPLRTVHLYLQFNGLPGYAWVFPKARHINVGIGCFASHPARLSDYYRLLLRLLRRWEMLPPTPEAGSLKGVKAGICPVDGPLPVTQTDRVLLVGDAAGFVSPATGAGILPAMISGQLAAQTLAEALERQRFDAAFLTRYQARWEQCIGRFRAEKIVQRFFLTPLCNLFIRIGERDPQIRSIIAGSQEHTAGGGYAGGVSIPHLLIRLALNLIKGPLGLL